MKKILIFALAAFGPWILGTILLSESESMIWFPIGVVLGYLPTLIYFIVNKKSVPSSLKFGLPVLIIGFTAIGLFRDSHPRASTSSEDTFIAEAEQRISSQTKSSSTGSVVDRVEMKGMHNEVLWIDYLIEVKSNNNYYYVIHRTGNDTIPSFTRITTWPYSISPIKDKKTLRGMLMNG